jgi:signal-transduction protein with cAMP-binding, CBS, and nucleotidyltransferase domain
MELPQHPRIAPLTVRTLLAQRPLECYSVTVDAKVAQALQVLAEHGVGAVVVRDGERVAGIFSEGDYVRVAAASAGQADATPVREAMRLCAAVASPSQAVLECLALMNEKRLRYLPVLEEGKLLGLLSLGDLQQAVIVYYERVCQARDLDQRIQFLQGTYSC